MQDEPGELPPEEWAAATELSPEEVEPPAVPENSTTAEPPALPIPPFIFSDVKPQPAITSHEPAWMLTLADMLSLMLTFFIMLYAVYSESREAWQKAAEALAQRLNPARVVHFDGTTAPASIEREPLSRASDLHYLHQVLAKKMKTIPALQSVVMQRLDDRIVLSVVGSATFAPGSAEVSAEGRKLLLLIGDLAGSFNNRIDINGNADPERPPDIYPSNWELALDRALAVAEILSGSGYNRKVRVLSRGDANYYALPAHTAKQDRHALARRIDIVIREAKAE